MLLDSARSDGSTPLEGFSTSLEAISVRFKVTCVRGKSQCVRFKSAFVKFKETRRVVSKANRSALAVTINLLKGILLFFCSRIWNT